MGFNPLNLVDAGVQAWVGLGSPTDPPPFIPILRFPPPTFYIATDPLRRHYYSPSHKNLCVRHLRVSRPFYTTHPT